VLNFLDYHSTSEIVITKESKRLLSDGTFAITPSSPTKMIKIDGYVENKLTSTLEQARDPVGCRFLIN